MFIKIIKHWLLIAFLFFGVVVYAGLPQSSGIYVEGNVGIGSGSALMGDANLGYKFNDFFALELGAATFSDFDSNYDNYFFAAAAKAILPFGKGFEAFGKLGMAEANSNNESKPAIYGGLGLGYAFTPNLGATIQGFTTTENDRVPSMYGGTVGITYIF